MEAMPGTGDTGNVKPSGKYPDRRANHGGVGVRSASGADGGEHRLGVFAANLILSPEQAARSVLPVGLHEV